MNFNDIPHFHVEVDSPRIEHGLSIIIHVLRAIHKEMITMAELDPMYQTLSETVAATQGEVNSAIALMNGLHAKLDAALASAPGDPTAALAAVKAAVDALSVSKQALADTVVADALPVEAPAPSTEPQPAPADGALPPSEPPAGTPLTQAEIDANTTQPVGGVTNPQPGDTPAPVDSLSA